MFNQLLIDFPRQEIERFCHHYHIRRLALFGSVLRSDFSPDSDLDLLVEFEPDHIPGLAFFGMQDELAQIMGRPVAPISKSLLSAASPN
jgi:predicted nucleotidyltransferase